MTGYEHETLAITQAAPGETPADGALWYQVFHAPKESDLAIEPLDTMLTGRFTQLLQYCGDDYDMNRKPEDVKGSAAFPVPVLPSP